MNTTEYAREVQVLMIGHIVDMYQLAMSSRGNRRMRAISNSLLATEAAIAACYCAVEAEKLEKQQTSTSVIDCQQGRLFLFHFPSQRDKRSYKWDDWPRS